MNPDLDPSDGMISRSALAVEVLAFRMKQLSEDIYCASWLTDLEFQVWDMAFDGKNSFGDIAVTDRMAKLFRDLATLADGWWVWPDTVGEEGSDAIFIPMERWKECLARRRDGKQNTDWSSAGILGMPRPPARRETVALTIRIRTVTVQHSYEKHYPQNRR